MSTEKKKATKPDPYDADIYERQRRYLARVAADEIIKKLMDFDVRFSEAIDGYGFATNLALRDLIAAVVEKAVASR